MIAAEPAGVLRGTSIFRSRDFRRFYAGQALSYLGDGLRTIAIPLLVFRLTHSAASLGFTFALEVLPFAFFSLIGGSLADRLDRRRLMIGCDAVRFVVVAAFALALWRGLLSLAFVYAGVVVLAVCGAVFLGCQSSSIPYLLGKDRAKAAVSVLTATEQSMNLIAPPVGGALFGLVGALPALAINAVTYLTSQLSVASVRTFGPVEPGRLPSGAQLVDDARIGLRFLWADRALRALTLNAAALNTVGIFGAVALIPYLKGQFGADDRTVGLAFGCFSLGSVVGALVSGRLHVPLGRGLAIAYLIDGLAWLPTVWTHSLVVAVAAVTFCTACGAFEATQIISWRMRIIPEELIGRTFGAVRLIVLIGMFPGSVGGGLVADQWGTRAVMALSGFVFLALASTLWANPVVMAERR